MTIYLKNIQLPLYVLGNMAGSDPQYIYVDYDKNSIDIIKNEEDILSIKAKLKISNENLSEFLQLSFNIPPKTIYKDLFVVNIGDTFVVDIIAKPKPFWILGMLVALEYTLLPGLEILLISLITGLPS